MLLLFAILGGLVLNLMPCVFPVLSIKALGLVEQAKKHPAAVRTKGLVFAAGVISSMLALAAVLLALRAGGEQIGWGFQLQSPLFVTLMAYLLFAVGLNLSGVFEVGGGLAGIGDSLTQGDSYHASFFTGVLTTLVATPCTAPFMAAAVGAALTQSPLVALVDFFRARIRPVAAVFVLVVCALAAARTSEARRLDGYAQASLRVPNVWICRMVDLGARAAADGDTWLGGSARGRDSDRFGGVGVPKIQEQRQRGPRRIARDRRDRGVSRDLAAGAIACAAAHWRDVGRRPSEARAARSIRKLGKSTTRHASRSSKPRASPCSSILRRAGA